MKTTYMKEIIKAERNDHPDFFWKFSGTDLFCLNMVIRGTWIFNTEFDSEKMKLSLKKLLNFYPILAGRMKGKEGIIFTNHGLPFVIAEKIDILPKDAYKVKNPIKLFSTDLKLHEFKKGQSAPMSVQVTPLRQGFVLGVQCAHVCMDGYSFYTMISNWAKLCCGKDIVPPIIDQSLLIKPQVVPKEELIKTVKGKGWIKLSMFDFIKILPAMISGKLLKRSRAFIFSQTFLKKIKNEMQKETGENLSTNSILSAFLVKKCIKLFNHPESKVCSIVTVTNVRNRLEKIPGELIGNFSTNVVSPNFPAGLKTGDLALKIQKNITPYLKADSSELKDFIQLAMNASHAKIPYMFFDPIKLNSPNPPVFYINNFSKLPIYDVDFGNGPVNYVIPHNLPDQIMIWPAPPFIGGVEVYFAGRVANEIDKLKEDNPWLKEMDSFS